MKCLRGGLVIVLLITGAVSAQESLYLGGELTVTDPETLEVSSIQIGSGGTFDYGNRLYINNGGYVHCLGSMDVNGTVSTGVDYSRLYSYASITGDGSLLEIEGDLTLRSYDYPGYSYGSRDPWGVPSHMEISGGAEASVAGDIAIISRSYMNISSGGHLSIGSDLTSSEGALNIASDGLLKMQLGDDTAGTRISVTGDSYLDGTLDILLFSGFSPAYGDVFDLFNWNGEVSGTFSATNTPTLSGGLYWDTSALYTTGSLTVIPEPASLAMICLVGCFGVFIRRRLMW